MKHTITLIPGDGVGPEVTEATRRCVEATGVDIDWDIHQAGETALQNSGDLLPASTLDSIRKNRVALKGPVTTPIGKGFRSVNVALRKELDLYANVRLCKSFPNIPRSYPNVDIVTVRENTEDLYAGIEFEIGKPETLELIKFIREKNGATIREDSGISLKPISETATARITRFACQYALDHNRKKVTAGHKANILKFSDGLFLDVARQTASEFPDVQFEDMIIDMFCMKLVQTPQDFDILLLPNLYGDILSDLCAGLIGGLGVAAGANIGEDIAVFEPVHGSAPKHTGKNDINPTACILSAVMMLRHLKEDALADKLEQAVISVLREGTNVTYDLTKDRRGGVSTSQMADAIISKL